MWTVHPGAERVSRCSSTRYDANAIKTARVINQALQRKRRFPFIGSLSYTRHSNKRGTTLSQIKRTVSFFFYAIAGLDLLPIRATENYYSISSGALLPHLPDPIYTKPTAANAVTLSNIGISMKHVVTTQADM